MGSGGQGMGLRGARGSSLQRSKGVESCIYNYVSTWFASHSNMTLRVVPTGSPEVKLTAFQGVKGWGFRVPGDEGVGLQGPIRSRGRPTVPRRSRDRPTGSQRVKG